MVMFILVLIESTIGGVHAWPIEQYQTLAECVYEMREIEFGYKDLNTALVCLDNRMDP